MLINWFRHIKTIILLLLVFTSIASFSAHLVGGEMNYRCLGNNLYEIELTIYRDCNGTGAAFDPFAKVGIFNGSTGSLVTQLNVPLPGFTLVPVNTVSSCLVVPPNICIQRAIYTDTITLPPSPSGYDIVYQRCCRNPTIVNITTPGNMGNTYHSFIPPNDSACNSSPSFNNFPPILLCINDPVVFDHSATDLDGDSLVYELFTPYTGGTNINPAPNPSPPPFTGINWGVGFNVGNQVTSSPQITIDSATGLITGTPAGLGQFVVGIAVKEYRNGVLLSVTRRDFQFNVLNCIRSVSSIFDPGVICNSYTVNFSNLSINATTYLWDFGDTTTLADTSVLRNPTYTYPDTGVYRVRLIADPYSAVCSDTSFIDLRVFPILQPFFDTPKNQCFENNSFDFKAKGNYTPTTQMNWDFGAGSNPASYNDSVINGVNYATSGVKTVSLRYREFGCDTTYSDTFRVYNEVISRIDSITTGCNSFTTNYSQSSTNPMAYYWNFGDLTTLSDTSILPSPTYTYLDSGTFRVSLIVKGQSTCADTSFRDVRIYPILDPFFIVPDNQCFKNNSVDFSAGGSFFNTTKIDWSFGANASKPSSILRNENGISYAQSGIKNISLTYTDFGCDTTYDRAFTVYREINPNFDVDLETVCYGDAIPIQFTSSTDTSFNFLWDFGDGNTSFAISPTHVYAAPGDYTITFIASDANCADTLTIPSKLSVLPSPIANFSPINISIPSYAPNVNFTNNSKNFISSTFSPLPGVSVTSFDNLTFSYSQDGYFYPTLVVENELGCTDSIVGRVLVKSELFVPNSFTPNNDGLNDLFIPVLTDPDDYELLIFNRWGELIFESNDPSKGWNGTNAKGELVETDSYIYRLVFGYESGEIQEAFGHVNLIR